MYLDVLDLVALRLVRVRHVVDCLRRTGVTLAEQRRRVLRGVLAGDEEELVFQLLAVVAKVVRVVVHELTLHCDADRLVDILQNLRLIEQTFDRPFAATGSARVSLRVIAAELLLHVLFHVSYGATSLAALQGHRVLHVDGLT